MISDKKAEAERKKLIKQMEEQRRQFDKQVEANRLQREKAAKAATSATKTPSARTPAANQAPRAVSVSVQNRQAEAEQKKRIKQMEDQRRQFEKQVEANRLQREKQRDLDNKFYAKQAAAIAAGKPVPVRRTPVKANTAQQSSKVNVVKKTSEESPAQAFERIFAPIYIPPSIREKRLDYAASFGPEPGPRCC